MDELIDFQHTNQRNSKSNVQESPLYENTRLAILNLVLSIIPFDELEKEHIQFVLSWLKSGAQIFRTSKPTEPNPHLVAYFVVADVEFRKILLVDHHRGERWFPTGGHVEPAEHPKNTVKREAREELGIEADFLFDHPLLVVFNKSF
jgi:8-oxo-dGTP diphosphatase